MLGKFRPNQTKFLDSNKPDFAHFAPAKLRNARLLVGTMVAKNSCYVGRNIIAATIPHAVVDSSKRSKATGSFDPMFRLNHTCAKIRAGIAVMARKTWTTTKSLPKLQDKLDIFIAVHNEYDFC